MFGWVFFGVFLSIWGASISGEMFSGSMTFNGQPVNPLAFMWFAVKTVVALLLILSYIWARLSYRFYRYELRDNGFRKESGVIYKSYVTIPYDRIQNVDVYRGILARMLGLSDLHIQTAGAGTMLGEGRLPGLSHEVAEQLRDELINRSRASRTGQGL